jgi:hypothetical protein
MLNYTDWVGRAQDATRVALEQDCAGPSQPASGGRLTALRCHRHKDRGIAVRLVREPSAAFPMKRPSMEHYAAMQYMSASRRKHGSETYSPLRPLCRTS